MNEDQKAILKEAVEWVEWQDTLEPGQRAWIQDDWVTLREEEEDVFCGTAYCIAGYIGQRLHPHFIGDEFAEIGGKAVHVSDFVIQELGLDDSAFYLADPLLPGDDERVGGSYVYDLFHSDNSAAKIRAIAEHLAGEPLV